MILLHLLRHLCHILTLFRHQYPSASLCTYVFSIALLEFVIIKGREMIHYLWWYFKFVSRRKGGNGDENQAAAAAGTGNSASGTVTAASISTSTSSTATTIPLQIRPHSPYPSGKTQILLFLYGLVVLHLFSLGMFLPYCSGIELQSLDTWIGNVCFGVHLLDVSYLILAGMWVCLFEDDQNHRTSLFLKFTKFTLFQVAFHALFGIQMVNLVGFLLLFQLPMHALPCFLHLMLFLVPVFSGFLLYDRLGTTHFGYTLYGSGTKYMKWFLFGGLSVILLSQIRLCTDSWIFSDSSRVDTEWKIIAFVPYLGNLLLMYFVNTWGRRPGLKYGKSMLHSNKQRKRDVVFENPKEK